MDPEKKILIQQLHFHQEELESALLEVACLRKGILGARGYGCPVVEADSLELGWAHEEPPHRHLNFSLQNIRHIGRKFPNLFLRLLEHNTLPGLAVFSPNRAQEPPLKDWRPDGLEAGREFMLFFPQDQSINARLLKMSASDFVLLRECALMASAYLSTYNTVSCNKEIQAWKRVAGGFLEQLENAQDSMHYDSLKTSCGVESKPTEISITLSNVFCASRFFENLHFVWRTGPKCELLIRSQSEDQSLFSSWPTFGSGIERVFPFGILTHPKVKRRAWNPLTAKEKVYLVGLAALLPDLVMNCIQQNPALARSRNKLLREAKYIYAEAIRLSKPKKIRRPFLGFFPF